ncbi:MAG TPA: hypothetical protein VF525_03290 [Pyrinomonadaceae bacterium]
MSEKIERMSEKVDRNADNVTALLAMAEIQAGEIKELSAAVRAYDEHTRNLDVRTRNTDERLNALINIVERYSSERRNGQT